MKHKVIKMCAILFILVGAFLVAWQPVINYIIAPYVIGGAQEEVLSLSHEDYIRNLENLESQINNDMFDFNSVESLSSLSVEVDLNHALSIGEIIIPSVDVHLPILMGTNNNTLKAGVGTMKPNQRMGEGNYSLAGHDSRNPNQLFAPIRNINNGEHLILTNKEKAYIYEMVLSEVVMPDRIEVINDVEDKKLITLVSCYSKDGSDRIIVQGELVEVVDYELLQEKNN